MKKCIRCGYETEENVNFCPECGYKLTELKTEDKSESSAGSEENRTCPKCGKEIENDTAAFCSSCGASLNKEQPQDERSASEDANNNSNQNGSFISSVKSDFKKSEAINQMGNVVSSVKNDLNNSEAINQVKTKVSSLSYWQKRNIKIAAIVAAVIILLIIIIANIHTCDECGDVYFGSKNEVSFFGETEDICDDCYDDLFGFDF